MSGCRWRMPGSGGRSRRASSIASTVPDRASILVTVGTELPFDRLVRAVDDWAGAEERGPDVFAQIGHTSYVPQHVGWTPMLEGPPFRRLFDHADLIVAHAGMGTILAALGSNRPLIVLPRRADLGEHRNDHQLATVVRLTERGLVDAARDEVELVDWLDRRIDTATRRQLGPDADPRLIAAVRGASIDSREDRRG